jgi:hypothetical protein
MKYRDIEELENLTFSDDITNNGIHQEIIADYIEKEKRKVGAKEQPFLYFYEDVVSEVVAFDFQSALGMNYYKNASDDAMSCLFICDEFRKLSSWNTFSWLQAALKFTDNLILHYIQEKLKEIPEKLQGIGVEKSRYFHLAKKTGAESVVGHVLVNFYDLRSDSEHRTIIYPNGRQELVPPKRNAIRRQVVKLYPDLLIRILRLYQESE